MLEDGKVRVVNVLPDRPQLLLHPAIHAMGGLKVMYDVAASIPGCAAIVIPGTCQICQSIACHNSVNWPNVNIQSNNNLEGKPLAATLLGGTA